MEQKSLNLNITTFILITQNRLPLINEKTSADRKVHYRNGQ